MITNFSTTPHMLFVIGNYLINPSFLYSSLNIIYISLFQQKSLVPAHFDAYLVLFFMAYFGALFWSCWCFYVMRVIYIYLNNTFTYFKKRGILIQENSRLIFIPCRLLAAASILLLYQL